MNVARCAEAVNNVLRDTTWGQLETELEARPTTAERCLETTERLQGIMKLANIIKRRLYAAMVFWRFKLKFKMR
jgi:hypothetical protein